MSFADATLFFDAIRMRLVENSPSFRGECLLGVGCELLFLLGLMRFGGVVLFCHPG
jgi:hypothetical protein